MITNKYREREPQLVIWVGGSGTQNLPSILCKQNRKTLLQGRKRPLVKFPKFYLHKIYTDFERLTPRHSLVRMTGVVFLRECIPSKHVLPPLTVCSRSEKDVVAILILSLGILELCREIRLRSGVIF